MDRQLLTLRALNRATLARQFLLERSTIDIEVAIDHLVGLQAQTPHTAYTGLWTRLERFDPEDLSRLLSERRVVRMALMRGTIHMVTARDAWGLRPLVQPVMDRVQKSQFGKLLIGVDGDELVAVGRALVDEAPMTFRALGDHLLTRWPDRDRFALEQAVRTGVPLVQVPPRGLWGRSGPVAHTSIEAWLGPRPPETMTLDGMVRRYLGAFGPASVMDAQAWCGLTRLGEVFERLRSELLTFNDERGRELFDLPEAPRPNQDTPAPVRFLYDFENMLLSYADRSRALPPELTQAIGPRNNESVSTFTVDGFAAGIWRVDRQRRSTTLVITPGRRLPKAVVAALRDEGEAVLTFLAADATNRDIRLAEPLG